ncbi:MAG: adenylate/guanylate cyclase domain-containing protein [Bacteroidota bacterium]
MKYLFVLSSCFFLAITTSGQNVDSLKKVIAQLPNSFETIDKCNDIGWSMLFQLRDSAEYFIEKSILLSDELDYLEGKARALKSKGVLMDMRGKSLDAIEYWNQSQGLFQQAGDLEGQASVLGNIGLGHYNLGDFENAELKFFESLELSDSIGYKSGISKACNNLARIYDVEGDFNKSTEYYLKALEINRELGNKALISGNLNNLGTINQEIANYPTALNYFKQSLEIDQDLGREKAYAQTLTNIGYTYFLKNEMDSAMLFYRDALEIQERLDVPWEVAQLNCNIGRVYVQQAKISGDDHQEDFELALPYLQRSLEIRTEINDQKGVIYTHIPIGEALLGMGKPNESIEQLEFARRASLRDTIWTNIIDADEALAEAYESLGKFELAYSRIQEKDSIYDLSLDEEQNSAIHQTQTDHIKKIAKAEKERDEAIIAANKAQRKFFIGGIIAAILAALGLLNRYRYVRKNRNIIAAEKKKSDDLLLNILPEETANELKEKGSADAQRFNDVSILFTDFKGFTAASGVMDPANLVSILHDCFSAFDDIIGKYKIEKIKTIGDAYMCVSGLPIQNPNHARDLVLAGLEFQAFVASKQGPDFPFTMRLGIHTGSVVSGIVGKKKFAYDIWGDAVNTAARMESKGEIGRVNVSEATYQIIKDEFECEARGAIEAKGKGKLNMFFVNGLKEVPVLETV